MSEKIAVIGLGYVGLPVAVALARKFDHVVGFDISERRISALQAGRDWTNEVTDAELAASTLRVTGDAGELAGSTFFIVTVPTPIDAERRPDLTPIRESCRTIAPHLSKGAAVVFESTVYPGVTDDICGPLLEAESGLKRGEDFTLGYSPERINPGDKANRLENITKIIAAEDEATLARLRTVYGSVVEAGLHEAPTIKVAEASKVIENIQRDINIALMNEIALIFDRMNIRTADVLEAAGTKWNFLPFRPGLVGGHCIGVDPYYLTVAAEQHDYHPEVILAGRRINDSMAEAIATKVVKTLAANGKTPCRARVGILGLTFKENVPDLRNTKVPGIVTELRDFGFKPLVHDPLANAEEAIAEYNIELAALSDFRDLDALILAVNHTAYVEEGPALVDRVKPDGLLVDVKSMLAPENVMETQRYWSL